MNKVILLGNLGQSPELKKTPSGTAVTNFSLATTEHRKQQDGSYADSTEWHKIVAWGKHAENCCKYLSKGRKVLVEGRNQTRSYDKDGQKVYVTEVVASQVHFVGQQQEEQKHIGGQDFGSEDIPF